MLEQSSETIDDILFQAKHPTEQTIKKMIRSEFMDTELGIEYRAIKRRKKHKAN